MRPTPSRPIRIRRAEERDVPSLLALMRRLAEFEGYAADFAVTAATLRLQGFARQPPDFYALVADGGEDDAELTGMLVYYLVAFTFRARSTLYVKELFVAESGQGVGTGEALMRAAAQAAIDHDCAVIKWQVADWNESAKRFYERLGATDARDWVEYALSESALRTLAQAPGDRDRT